MTLATEPLDPQHQGSKWEIVTPVGGDIHPHRWWQTTKRTAGLTRWRQKIHLKLGLGFYSLETFFILLLIYLS